MGLRDADKKVEEAKQQRPGHYQSSQYPNHFDNEGQEYINPEVNDNDIMENADYDKIHGIEKPKGQRAPVSKSETELEAKNADRPEAAEESGIPSTANNDKIGIESSGAGLGANQSKGTTDFPNK